MSIWMITSLDSLIAAAGLGLLGSKRRYRSTICLGFMSADALGTLVGLLLRGSVFANSASSFTSSADLILAGLFAAFLICQSRERRLEGFLWLVPCLLSLDNLFAAMSGRPDAINTQPVGILVCALASGAFAFFGLEAGSRFSRLMRAARVTPIAGILRSR